MKKKTSRRKFIKNMSVSSAMAFGPIEVFTSQILCGSNLFMNNAQAQMLESPMNYINFFMQGGPGRRIFDQPLQVVGQPDAEFSHNNFNKFTNYDPSSIETTYESILHKGILLPYLNSMLIPTSSGGTVPLKEIFNQALIMRGIDLGRNDHEGCRLLITKPSGATSSIQAKAAEASSAPIGNINFGATSLPFSSASAQELRVNTGKPVESIFAYTRSYADRLSYNSGDISERIKNVIEVFAQKALKNNVAISSLQSNKKSALQLVNQNIDALYTGYAQTIEKYELLIRKAIDNASLAGVFDPLKTRPDTEEITSDIRFSVGVSKTPTQHKFLNSMITEETVVKGLASSFAITEICILNNLTSSICANGGGGLHNLNFYNGEDYRLAHIPNDSHLWGSYSVMFLQSYMFAAIGTCINELIAVLKANTRNGNDIYSRSVIQLTSEFNSYQYDWNTNHHGYGQSTTFFTGKLNKPMVVGNIDLSRKIGGVPQGSAAPVAELDNRKMHAGNIVSTAAELLEVESPVPNDSSAISVDKDGNPISKVGTAKNIA